MRADREVSAQRPCAATNRRTIPALLASLILLHTALPAHAHRINLFAWVENNTIHGSVYFAGGGKAQGVTVRVLTPDNVELGSAISDARGAFTFRPTQSVDHRLVAETGDGHRAEFLITADALAGRAAPPAEPTTVQPAPPATPDVARLQRELTALRNQLQDQSAHVRVRDVFAGVGYIVGIAGLAYYLLQRKNRRKPGT